MKTIKALRVHVTRAELNEAHAPYAKIVTSSRDVHRLAQSLTEHEDQEVFLVFCLDAKNRITGYSETARGTIDSCMVHMRDVFRVAVLQGAVSIIVAHNHPSGDPTPSDADNLITRKLVSAGKLLDMPVLDHVIVGASGYYSYLDAGALRGES